MQNSAPLSLHSHAPRETERRCLDEMLKHSIAGHTIDPESLLHGGVLCFDERAVEQETVLVNHLCIVTSTDFSGDRAVM